VHSYKIAPQFSGDEFGGKILVSYLPKYSISILKSCDSLDQYNIFKQT
jgi:hypothetical protein